jgi:hypothetical protein
LDFFPDGEDTAAEIPRRPHVHKWKEAFVVHAFKNAERFRHDGFSTALEHFSEKTSTSFAIPMGMWTYRGSTEIIAILDDD